MSKNHLFWDVLLQQQEQTEIRAHPPVFNRDAYDNSNAHR